MTREEAIKILADNYIEYIKENEPDSFYEDAVYNGFVGYNEMSNYELVREYQLVFEKRIIIEN